MIENSVFLLDRKTESIYERNGECVMIKIYVTSNQLQKKKTIYDYALKYESAFFPYFSNERNDSIENKRKKNDRIKQAI